MAIGEMTERIVDKATGLFKKGFATFDKIVFLEDEQQDTLNEAVTAFEIYNKTVTNNIEEIETSISRMEDVKQVKEVRDAMERLRTQGMQDTAKRIAAGENVGIEQTKQFSKDLLIVKQGLHNLDTNISMSFDNLVDTYVKQTISNANSMKAQEDHFRSLFITMNKQSEYLKQQIEYMEKQENLDEAQLNVLEANKRDLNKLNQFSDQIVHFSKMGPEEFKKNKQILDLILGELSDQIFESKMYTTMNMVDNSIQSLSVDSERLNETMEDLTEAQISGKEVIAGTAMKLKQGAKGMVSSMVLSAMGLGGLDEALGISEKFAELDLFGKTGLFGKGGLLANITKLKGTAGIVGGGLAVAGAGAAGYAFGNWLNKKIDEMGGEKGFLGSKLHQMLMGDDEKRAMEAAEVAKITGKMSVTLEGTEKALKIMDQKINEYHKELEDQWFVSKEEEQKLDLLKKHREALGRKMQQQFAQAEKEKEKEKRKSKIKIQIAEEMVAPIVDERVVTSIMEEEVFKRPIKRMTDKTKRVSSQISRDQRIDKTVSPKVFTAELETGLRGVTPEEIRYLPKTMEDTTEMIIKNTKEENKKIIEAQKPTVVVPPIPTPPAPVDLSKSIDDPTLIALNNDLFG